MTSLPTLPRDGFFNIIRFLERADMAVLRESCRAVKDCIDKHADIVWNPYEKNLQKLWLAVPRQSQAQALASQPQPQCPHAAAFVAYKQLDTWSTKIAHNQLNLRQRGSSAWNAHQLAYLTDFVPFLQQLPESAAAMLAGYKHKIPTLNLHQKSLRSPFQLEIEDVLSAVMRGCDLNGRMFFTVKIPMKEPSLTNWQILKIIHQPDLTELDFWEGVTKCYDEKNIKQASDFMHSNGAELVQGFLAAAWRAL